jgi:CheY-like chemotaxis protein
MPRHNPLLIVDDNAATRYAMRRVLERHGYPVMEAGTGSEGLALMAQNAFAALILDVNLPDISGFDIVRHLRSQATTRLLPVIHVSAASIETNDLITGLDAGHAAHLVARTHCRRRTAGKRGPLPRDIHQRDRADCGDGLGPGGA